VGAELVPIATSEETLPWSIGPLDPIDQVPRYDLGGIGRTDAEHVSETQ